MAHEPRRAAAADRDRVLNEGFCMALAMVLGLRPAATEVQVVEGRWFLRVQSHDCFADENGQPRPVREENLCQALGVLTEATGEKAGGPGLAQCFALLRRATHPSMPQQRCFLDCVIFNALIGNHAADGASYALLYFERDTVLAPLQGVLSTAVYAGAEMEMAMRIGGHYRFHAVQAQDWAQFAQEAGLDAALVKGRVRELAQALPPAARRLQSNPCQRFAGSALVERVITLIERRCALTVERLGDFRAEDNAASTPML